MAAEGSGDERGKEEMKDELVDREGRCMEGKGDKGGR